MANASMSRQDIAIMRSTGLMLQFFYRFFGYGQSDVSIYVVFTTIR